MWVQRKASFWIIHPVVTKTYTSTDNQAVLEKNTQKITSVNTDYMSLI